MLRLPEYAALREYNEASVVAAIDDLLAANKLARKGHRQYIRLPLLRGRVAIMFPAGPDLGELADNAHATVEELVLSRVDTTARTLVTLSKATQALRRADLLNVYMGRLGEHVLFHQRFQYLCR